MPSEVRNAKSLIAWYEGQARTFLQSHQPEKLPDLDKDCDAVRAVLAAMESEVAVCFLGSAGVGKSTLLNALVGGSSTIVPSGGVGPLTAQALTVRFAEQPRFEVRYHLSARLQNLIRALEWGNRSELRPLAFRGLGPPKIFTSDEDSPTAIAVATELRAPGNRADAEEPPMAPREEYRKTAQLIVSGNQDGQADLPYLIDSLYEIVGKLRVWGTQGKPEDASRIRRVSDALEMSKRGETYAVNGRTDDRKFMDELRDHACGFLAPLIDQITIYWDCDLLRDGVVLVDLPGVGIAGDRHELVTRKWIREKAHAIVLVVDHRGITQPVAELLRRSEFLNRLVYSADEPQGDPVLLVAVVKIDDVAEEYYRQDRSKKKAAYFVDECQKADPLVKSQLRSQLESVWSNGDGASAGQMQVIGNILSTLEVHPLSAIQFRKVLLADDDDQPFVRSLEGSNVPRLRESLQRLTRDRHDAKLRRLREKSDVFRDRVVSLLRVIEAQWQEQTRATEEAERLRSELSDFMQDPRKELHVRQGNFRQFLKKTVPQRIADLVQAARSKAQLDINKYLNRLGHAHWATLRASVRRGGRYSGATDIDLSREFALRFEEPIAETWTKEILKDIRRETREYAADCVRLVGTVVEWAKSQGARVQPRLVEAQYEAVKADAKKLESVGRELVAELREEAKNQLIETIEEPIRQGCRRFVERNADVGSGVKDRILGLYGKLAEEVTEAATKPATGILTKLFREVEKEITAAFEDHQDPLAAAVEAIVTSQETYLKRSDAQKRKAILQDLETILSALPVVTPLEIVTTLVGVA